MNRKEINADTISYEDFVTSSQGNNVGDHVEVPMGGPWTAKRFVVSRRDRHPSDAGKIVLTALAVVYHAGRELDPVAGTVKHCGKVVARYVHDAVCCLHFIGEDLSSPQTPCVCADSAQAALTQFFS